MGNVKYRFENFSFYDHSGIRRHLEQMAQKGWLLERAGTMWKYRAIEPKKIAFTVTYCAHASVFDPKPSEQQQQFIDLCAHTGWVPVKTVGQMQIFYNESPDAPPLQTDPVVELEGMHRALKKNFLPATLVLLLCYAVMLYCIFAVHSSLVFLLTDGPGLGAAVLLFMAALFYIWQLAGYFLYRRRALRAAEAYQLVWGDGPILRYLLRWGTTVVDIEFWDDSGRIFGDELTAQQRELVIEAFSP